ncbi:MAG: methyltransferase domain-containing protein [Pseudonocardia sp.]
MGAVRSERRADSGRSTVTSEDVLDAALTLFAARGYHGTALSGIAETLGIRTPSLYNHMRSKHQLLETIVERTLDDVLADFHAAAAGVADRVEVRTADMTALPFADDSFDVVTSALAIHNIPSLGARYRAVDEAMRVLRPGGQLLVADISAMARAYAAHIGHGALRPLGPEYWYGGPWFGVTLLRAVKR